MPRDRRRKRDLHALTEDGMVLCNPRDKEAAHRAEMEGIATADRAAVTCRKCLDLLHKADRERRERPEEKPEPPIRRAVAADVETLVDVWLRSVRATHAFLTEADIQGYLPLVREYLASDAELWVLCSDAGAVLGFMGLSGNKIEALFLAPEHLRQGHGRRLVRHARELRGELTVDVNEQNPEACRFYEACGFVVEGHSELDGTGRPFPLLHLRLPSAATLSAVEACLERAHDAEEASDREAALANYTEALRLLPGHLGARIHRGNVLSDLGRFDEAAADFRAALLRPGDHAAGVRFNLGNALYNLGRPAEALAEYDEAARLDPSFGWAHHGRAHTLSALGCHEEALAAADEAVRLLPDHPLVMNGRAVALAELGRHEEALAAFAETLRLDPRFGTAYVNRALLHEQMGRPDLAHADRHAERRLLPPEQRPLRASDKMQRLYHRFSELCGGEPDDLWIFDPLDFPEPPPPHVGVVHVMAWPADARCDVTSFLSLGMSDRRMAGADYFCEVFFSLRASLTSEQRLAVARRVADFCAYPFHHGLKLDWWEVIRDPGPLPGFPNCKHLLLHPRLAAEGFDRVADPEGPVKVLYLIPITPLERHLILEHGRQALIEHFVRNEIDVLRDRRDPPG